MSVLNALQRKYTLVGFKGPVTLQDIIDTAIAGGSGGGGGDDGVSVTGATIDANGNLIITLSNGSTLNAGRALGVDGADGQDGTNGREIELNNDGTGIRWRYVGDTTWNILVALTDITGPKGDKGDTGNAGAAGTNGNTILTVSSAPAAGVGANGDYAYNPANWTFYGPKSAGAWPAGVVLKGTNGTAGKGVSSAVVTYQAHTSGTTAPTGTWTSTVPTMAKGAYLWTRTVTTYTDNTTTTAYSVAYQGADGTGGGSSTPWYWNPPVAADFTLLSGDANNLTLTNDADVGLMIKSGPIVGGAGDLSRIAVKPIPNPAANWDIKVHALTFSDGQDYTKILPLVLRDSVGGRMTTMAMTNEYITYANINLASLTAYGGAVGDGFQNKGGAPLWFRVACVGTTLTYYVSMDGKNWLDVATAGVTSYLANRPNQVGFGVNFNKTTGKKAVITIDHFSITQ